MEADVHRMTKADGHELETEFNADMQRRAMIAFAAGCRLAVFVQGVHQEAGGFVITYDFVFLSPGEKASPGWTIYENRDGRAVGRSA